MATDLEQLLADALPQQREAQFALRDLLNEELAEPHALVSCADKQALLHLTADGLTFYFVDELESGRPGVRTVRVPTPRGARIEEERHLHEVTTRSAILRTARLRAEHPSFPAGSVEYDCSNASDETVDSLRGVFQSWVAAPGRA